MAITNHDRVGKAMELLRQGLAPFVERELKAQYQQAWLEEIKAALPPQQLSIGATEKDPMSDVATVLATMWNKWQEVFRKTLGHAERSLASPHIQADDAEVGGVRGREALDRLRNVVGRLESSWRPASAEEGFEIVRRRLFEPLAGPDQFKHRDVVAREFFEMGMPGVSPRRSLRISPGSSAPTSRSPLRSKLRSRKAPRIKLCAP